MADRSGCSAALNSIGGCWFGTVGVFGGATGAAAGGYYGFTQYGALAGVAAVPLGFVVGWVWLVALALLVLAFGASVLAVIEAGPRGLRMWTPISVQEWVAWASVFAGAVAGGVVGAGYGSGWAVVGVFAGASGLLTATVLVSLPLVAVGGAIYRRVRTTAGQTPRAGGGSHGNG